MTTTHEPDPVSQGVSHEASLEALLATLPLLAAEARLADERLHARVALLKDRRATWAEIGSALNVSRQAAWQRFGRASRLST